MSKLEQTLSLIKPDAVERNLEEEIKQFFVNAGFKIAKQKKVAKLAKELEKKELIKAKKEKRLLEQKKRQAEIRKKAEQRKKEIEAENRNWKQTERNERVARRETSKSKLEKVLKNSAQKGEERVPEWKCKR